MTTIPSTPAALFGLIMSTMIGEVSMRCAKLRHLWPVGWRVGEIPLPYCTILHRRLTRATSRIQLLFARAEARAAANGGIPVPVASSPPKRTNPKKPTMPHAYLPGRLAWLAGIAPETATLGQQMHDLVTRPDVQPLIASDPAFGRILRPLFHTIGVKSPEYLQLPKRKRLYIPKPRQPREKTWSLDYEKSKENWTGPPATLPPWYLPKKPTFTPPAPRPLPAPPPPERPTYQHHLARLNGHGQR